MHWNLKFQVSMKLKVSKESASGLNTEFVNVETGRRIPLEQAVAQISKGNKNYENYQVVTNLMEQPIFVQRRTG